MAVVSGVPNFRIFTVVLCYKLEVAVQSLIYYINLFCFQIKIFKGLLSKLNSFEAVTLCKLTSFLD